MINTVGEFLFDELTNICSLHLLLSISKEDSFLCRDARIRTRDLEYRNQTWSVSHHYSRVMPLLTGRVV